MANDIFEILAEDHRRVEGIIEALEGATEPADRMELLNDLTLAFVPHARGEELLVYPRIKEDERGAELEDNAEEEHAMADELLAELQAMGGDGEGFNDRLAELKTAIQHHVSMEESDMFTLGREIFSEEQIEELARDFEDAKLKVQASLERVADEAAFEEPARAEGSAAPPP